MTWLPIVKLNLVMNKHMQWVHVWVHTMGLWHMAVGQNMVLKLEAWLMQSRTKTCGPLLVSFCPIPILWRDEIQFAPLCNHGKPLLVFTRESNHSRVSERWCDFWMSQPCEIDFATIHSKPYPYGWSKPFWDPILVGEFTTF